MMDRHIAPETLNAYVDGELSPADAAEVARAAADDPVIADRIACLREMKAAISDVVPPAELALPPRPRQRWRPRRVAAAITGLAAMLVLGVFLSGLFVSGNGPDWPSVLESHHRSWAFNQGAKDTDVLPATMVGDLPVLDLSAARLAFVGRERIRYRELTLERLGYEGARGCRLSLFTVPRELGVSVNDFASPFLVRVWRESDHDILLMAERMDATRFADIAAAIESTVRRRRPFDDDTRQRLAATHELDRPCRV